MLGLKRPKWAVIPWWVWVVGIDLFLITITVLKQYPVVYPGRGRLTRHFNLAVEGNAGVWWSGICLLAAGLLAYELYCRSEEKSKLGWLALAIVLAGLSLDEIGSIHEIVSAGTDRGWLDLLPYGVVVIALVASSVTVLFKDEKTKRSSLYVAAAFFVFGGVALQEHLEHIVTWPGWAQGIRVGVEEGSELLGEFLLFCGIIPQRYRRAAPPLRAAVPAPFLMKHLAPLVLGGFFLHFVACILCPLFIDVTHKGNLLGWYPIAVFFLLFSAAFWKSLEPSTEKAKLWSVLSVFFLCCSIGFIYEPPRLLFGMAAIVPVEYLPGFFLFTVVAGLLVLSAGIPSFWASHGRYFPVLFLLPVLCLMSGAPGVQYLLFGLLSYLVCHIFGEENLIGGREVVEYEHVFADLMPEKKGGGRTH